MSELESTTEMERMLRFVLIPVGVRLVSLLDRRVVCA